MTFPAPALCARLAAAAMLLTLPVTILAAGSPAEPATSLLPLSQAQQVSMGIRLAPIDPAQAPVLSLPGSVVVPPESQRVVASAVAGLLTAPRGRCRRPRGPASAAGPRPKVQAPLHGPTQAYSGAMPTAVTAPPKPRRSLLAALLSAVLLSSVAAFLPGCTRPQSGDTGQGTRLQGSIAAVSDGDSFTLVDADGRRIGIRIAGIDAPEKSQPHADAARDHLARMLALGSIEILPIKTDPFGRRVSRVHARGQDVALRQLQAGLAWHFMRYAGEQPADERERYALAEREARLARRGLWADPQPQAPWTFRQRNRG